MTALRSWMISLARSRPLRASRVSASRLAVDGGRGERGERAEQGDLLPLEHPGAAVGGEQHPDDVLPERQGHPEDRDEPSSRTPLSMEVCWKRPSRK